MTKYSYSDKLHIAKEAYKGIKHAIDAVENHLDIQILCHWDECITVDDELFHGHQMREND